jgi:hypothetical protein
LNCALRADLLHAERDKEYRNRSDSNDGERKQHPPAEFEFANNPFLIHADQSLLLPPVVD